MSERLENPADSEKHPFLIPNFSLLWASRLLAVLAMTGQAAAIAWHIYEIARKTNDIQQSALYVGMFGLAQFLALFAMTIPAGIMVDRVNRKSVVMVSLISHTVLSLVFFLYAGQKGWPIWGLFVLGLFQGGLRAFLGPSQSSLWPMLVSKTVLHRGLALNNIAFQGGAIVGPAIGGFMVSVSPQMTYLVTAVAFFISALMCLMVKGNTTPEAPTTTRMGMLIEGIEFVRSSKPLMGAMSLDLLAVLLAGSTALLPVFARDILHVSGLEYGILRAALPFGAIMVSIWLSIKPLRRHAGYWMYACVAAFGVATIGFGLSEFYWLSVALMVIMGATDMISVYVRGALVQIVTPDPMRGRVSAVSQLFIGASNELGEFESGLATKFLGPIGAALFGGIGSVVVTGVWIKLFPELFKTDRLDAVER